MDGASQSKGRLSAHASVDASWSAAAAIFFEQSPTATLLVDAVSSLIEAANPAAALFLGRPLEGLAGHPLSAFTPFGARNVTGGRASREHQAVMTADGRELWCIVTVTPVGSDERGHRLAAVQIEDITDHAETRQWLAARKAVFRSAFEDAAIGMVIFAPDGAIVEANPAAAAMLGYAPGDLRGLRARDLSATHAADPADVADGPFEWLAPPASGGLDRFRMEHDYLRKGGGRFSARVTSTVVRDGEGRVTRVLSQIEDISALKAAEQALAASEAWFRAIVLNSTDVIAIFDADLTVTWISPSAPAVLGRQPDEFIGRKPFEFIHPDDAARMKDRFPLLNGEALAASGVPVSARVRDRDGIWRWFEVVFDDPSSHDVVGGYVCHIRDMTAAKEAEQALRQALEMQQGATTQLQETMKQRSDFLAMVAHDFRTPLTAIKGYADLLSVRLRGAGDEDGLDSAETISESARRLNRMVESLLHLDDLEGDLPPLKPVLVDPGPIIAAAVEQARSVWPGREVDLDIEPGLPALEVDADLVSRAIGNLIDNAIKYSPDGQPVEVAAIPNVDGVRLTVTDRGVGIPPRELPRIFEKFTRVNDPAVEGVDGSGLGLPIVRAIARAHGGDAWAESVPGEGTTVNLVLRSASRG